MKPPIAAPTYNTISWRNENTPLPMENRPRALFERLFGAAGTTDPKVLAALRQEDRSILDAVSEDVKRLRGKLGADGPRQDRPVPRTRCATSSGASSGPRRRSDRDMPALEGPGGIPSVFSDYYKLMADRHGPRLADRHDARHHVPDGPRDERPRSYPELGFSDSHHSQTHHHGEAEKIAKVIQINTFHTKMLAYYLDKLRSTPDGDGSLLDHTLILYGAALSDANLHLYTDLPLLLVGGGINGIKGGQHINYPSRTPMTNLLLTMLDKAGVPKVGQLGDSTGRLDLAGNSKSVDAAQRRTL